MVWIIGIIILIVIVIAATPRARHFVSHMSMRHNNGDVTIKGTTRQGKSETIRVSASQPIEQVPEKYRDYVRKARSKDIKK